MTLVKYLMATGVCTARELLVLKRDHAKDYATIIEWTREQMTSENVTIDEPAK